MKSLPPGPSGARRMCSLANIRSRPFRPTLAVRYIALGALLSVLPVMSAFAAQSAQGDAPAPHHHTRHHSQPAPEPPPAQVVPAPVVPETPKWPVNETPTTAQVSWDSHGLRIAATNSSLHQILNEVSSATGAKVEGLGADERVFGEYGPGDARDVLSQLLNGSGYNVLMVGDQGQGTPRQIILSARRAGSAPHTANQPNGSPDMQPDEDVPDQPEPEEQPQPPAIIRPPMPQSPEGTPPRTPQQMLQELQQRQIQMQQLQQQQQQNPQQPQ